MTSQPREITAAREALCRFDADDRCVFVNDEGAAHLGLPREELLGQLFWHVFPEAGNSEIGQVLRQARQQQRPYRTQVSSASLGRWVDVSVYPDGDGLLIHFRDMHDQKLVAVRSNRLQAVTEALASALTLAEVVEVMLEVAIPATEADAGAVLLRTTDARHLELVGQQGYEPDAVNFMSTQPLDANTPLTHAVHLSDALYLTPADISDRYPHVFPVSVLANSTLTVVLPLSAGADALGVWQLTFAGDVTLGEEERGFIETLARLSALALARAELYADLERAVEKRTLKLHQLNSEMRAYADAVTRDLAPSLRRLRDFADVLARRLLTHLGPDEARFFEHIQTEGERMARVIDDLGTFVASGQEHLNFANVPLAQLVEGVRVDLAPLLRQRSVVWTVQNLPIVRGNAQLLRQTLAALLSNALKYTRERDVAVIEVGADRGTHEWVVWVRDNGTGLPQGAEKSVFRASGTAMNATPPFSGAGVTSTGLTLSNVHRVISRHGGRVWAESPPEGGATFYFTLPDHPTPPVD